MVALVVLLSAGWPLINATLTDGERLRAGHRLQLTAPAASNGGGTRAARLTVPDGGWTLSRAQTTAGSRYQLHRDEVRVTIRWVSLEDPSQADELWSGLRRVTRAADRNAVLGSPVPTTTAQSVEAETGTLRQHGCRGDATVLYAPDRAAAVVVTALDCATSGDSTTALQHTADLVDQLRFSGATTPEAA